MIRRLLPFILLATTGCAFFGGPESVPEAEHIAAAWRSPTIDGHKIRRVVVVPFQDLTGHPEAARAVQQSVIDEIQRLQPFEIFHANNERILTREEEEHFLNAGTIDKEALVRVSREHHADAVLYGAVTRFRAYEPMLVGLKLNLVSAGAGDVVWSVSALFDAGDAQCARDVHNWFANHADQRTGANWRTTLLSPARFSSYASSRVVATW